MAENTTTRIRLFGNLHSLRRERGLPSVAELQLPEEGLSAIDIAHILDLPLQRIEGVFCNHLAYALDHRIYPGDEVAFIPTGVPGPHRFMLGIHQAGKGHLKPSD